MAIVKGTKENFEAEVLKANGVVVVDPNKKIVKVDIDEQEELAAQYKIMSVPTLLVFKNGEIVDKSIGLIQKQEVKLLFAK